MYLRQLKTGSLIAMIACCSFKHRITQNNQNLKKLFYGLNQAAGAAGVGAGAGGAASGAGSVGGGAPPSGVVDILTGI